MFERMFTSSLVCKAAVFVQVVILLNTVSAQLTPSELSQYGVPPSGFHSFKPYTNETIDEILTRSLGGIGAAVQKMLAPNGYILAELDMLLTPPQFNDLFAPTSYREKRKAVREKSLRWTDAALPYEFIKGDFNAREIYFMKLAMTEWEKYSCVRFRASRTMDRNVVRIKNGNGCSSQLGMVGGVQELNLEPPGCRFKGLYLHELAHAIGLVHEHQLPTRDEFIDILWYNVDEQMRIWFEKYNEREVNQYKVPYDLTSVMHYGISAFSKDGRSQTIKAKDPTKESTIGRVYSKELSFSDVKTVNLMYQCSAHCSSKRRCQGEGFLDQNCNCICPDGSSDCQVGKVVRYKDGCKNEHDSWQCYIWANQGECKRNPKFMMKACEKACGVCDIEKTDSKKKDEECKDEYPNDKCERWKKFDECVTNKQWMEKNCKKTCDACKNQPPVPTDQTCSNTLGDDACSKKLADGGCQMDKKYMFDNCQKSCQWCDKKSSKEVDNGDEAEIDENDKDLRCIDEYEKPDKCTFWASRGECRKNAVWMIPNCRKSCKKCHEDGVCTNLYDDTQCEQWARVRECEKNPTWMKLHCRRSCKACDETGKGSDEEEKEVEEEEETDTGGCRNIHDNDKCKTWAYHGHCDINPSFMLKQCKKACRVCKRSGGSDETDEVTTTTRRTTIFTIGPTTTVGGSTTKGERTPPTPTGHPQTTTIGNEVTCYDANENCASWAKVGYCNTNPKYNLIHCRYSCKNCNGCKDENLFCKTWAKGGQCEKNVAYMLRRCQKSCAVCDN